MRKTGFILTTLLLVSVLTGCTGYEDGYVSTDGTFKAIGDRGSYDVLRDTQTGCLYLEPKTEMGLSPLYDKEGSVMGCGQSEENTKNELSKEGERFQ